ACLHTGRAPFLARGGGTTLATRQSPVGLRGRALRTPRQHGDARLRSARSPTPRRRPRCRPSPRAEDEVSQVPTRPAPFDDRPRTAPLRIGSRPALSAPCCGGLLLHRRRRDPAVVLQSPHGVPAHPRSSRLGSEPRSSPKSPRPAPH